MAQSSTPVNDDEQLWWSSWWQAAKDKSTAALEFMKNDLAEFGQTVHQDAVSAITATSSVFKQTLRLDDKDSVASQTKEGLQTLFVKIGDAFYPTYEKDDDELVLIRNSQPVTVEKWHAHLHYIQTHPSNYSHKPEGMKEQYQKWLETFAFEDHRKEISDTLASSPEVRTLYTGIVPTILSNLEFWQRFFYRIFQADETHFRRADLMRRADKLEPTDELKWDDYGEGEQPQTQESEAEVANAYENKKTESKESVLAETNNFPEENAKDSQTSLEVDKENKSSLSLVDSLDKMAIINSSPSSSDSDVSRKANNTEDEWEKDFDLEEAPLDEKVVKTATAQDDDWENWE